MKHIKLFENFDDDEFDFLANIGKMEKAIIKTVEIHEKHYYNDNKISSDPDFLKSIKELIESSMTGYEIFTDDYMSVISSFEERKYNDGKFNLIDDRIEESMFDIIEDLIYPFINTLLYKSIKSDTSKEKAGESIWKLGKESDHILSNIEDNWVSQSEIDPNRKKLGDLPEINLN